MRGRAPRWAHGLALGLTGLVASACPGDDAPAGPDPLFPEDYAARYTEVRNCRGSGDHDLHNIRILVDAAARVPYEGRQEPFPVGSVVLKEEYDFGDVTCSGELLQWTVMQKLEPGSVPEDLDWTWQQVDGTVQGPRGLVVTDSSLLPSGRA